MKLKAFCTKNLLLIVGLLLLAGTGNRVQAATTFTTTSTASGNWSTAGNWAGGTAPTGNQAGNIATMSTAAGITLTLDVATTIGQVTDSAGSSRAFTINASGTTAMTFDNTGGVNNPVSTAAAYIGEGSSGPVTFLPNIVIQNTDLVLGNTGSTSPTLTIGTLGTSTITATTPQTLVIWQAQATSTKSINVNSSIGSSGSVITITNASTGGGASTMNLNGVVGPNAAVFQNSANAALSLNAANTYTGSTTITLGTLRLGIANAIPSASSVSVTGTLNLNGFNDTIDGLSGAGMVTNSTGTAVTLTVGGNNSGGTFSGIIGNNTGALSLTKIGSGTEILSGANTYSGVTTFNGGALNAGGAENPGVSGPFGKANTAGSIAFGGGALQYSAANGSHDYSPRFSTAANQPIKIDTAGQTVTFATALTSSGGSLTVQDSVGGGTLTLTADETYSGNTTVNGGTLALSGSVALASSSSIAIGAGGTFDVSALGASATYALGSGAAMKASGTGTIVGSTAANFKVGASGILNLGSQPISLTWGGGSSGTDSTHPPLYLSQGTLDLSGNTITVIVPGTALGVGVYTLISAPAITGTPSATPSYTGGNGVAPGNVGVISVSGGNVILTISASGGVVGTWNVNADGNWSDATKWSSNPNVPHAAGDSATFGTGSALRTVTLDANETVGLMTMNNNNSFVIANSGKTLTLDNSGVGVAVSVTGGTANMIETAVALNDNTVMTVGSGKSLTISGAVNNTSGAKTLTLDGAGTTILSGANGYGPSAGSLGTTLSAGGTLQLGDNTALGAGDASVSGNSTIQAGAAGLSVGNNVAIADTTTVDNNGNNLTLGGVISGGGGISKINSGTLTLNGNNTYSGNTTVGAGAVSISSDGASAGNAGNLGTVPSSATANNIILNGGDLLGNGTFVLHANRGIGIGPVSGGTGATALIDAASGQTFTINGVIASAGNGGTDNLTVNSLAPTPGTVALGGANTFAGTTTIAGGTLQLTNALALQNSTLNYSSGSLTFDSSLTAATLGGLSGAQSGQNLSLVNGASAAVALTAGGNNASTIYGGNLSGAGGSLTKSGNGSLTLSNANYTGATTVNGTGVLTITGGSFGSSSANIVVNGTTSGGNILVVSGGTAAAQAFNVAVAANQTGVGATINGNANASFTSSGFGSANNTLGNVTINTSGNVALGTAVLGKDGAGQGSTRGLIIQAGTVTATSMDVQGAGTSTATAANLNLDGGSLTIGNSSSSGAFKVGDSGTAGHGGYLTMTNGTLTYLGTDGLLAANNAVGNVGVINISGGTADLTGVTLNAGNSTTANSTLTMGGAVPPTLYLGSVGLVANAASSGTVGATFSNVLVGATADWSSSAAAAITNMGLLTLQAADVSAVPHNVSLNGVISGSGSLTKTGGGTLTLSGANTYTGNTVIDAGIVNAGVAEVAGVSGPFGVPATVAGSLSFGGGTLQYSGANNADYSGRFVTAGSQPISIDTAGQTVAFATQIQGAGTTLTKTGNGTLSLSAAAGNTYTGNTTVNGGTLAVNNTSGSGTGSGSVTINSGGFLGGDGIISGAVMLNSGGGLAPGNSVGTNTVGSLTMSAGSINNFEFNANPANDQTIVTTSGGLVINGGAFNLYMEGGLTAWTAPATYKLIQYSGALSGSGTSGGNLDSTWTTASASNPHIANPQSGLTYRFGTSGGWITLTIFSSQNVGSWGVDADGNWSVAGNWTALSGSMPPRNAGDSAIFGTGTTERTVTLDANETVGNITVNNNNSFVIANSGKTLTLDNSGAGTLVNIAAGTQNAIQTAVALNDNTTATVSGGKSLSISGNIGNSGGSKTLTANGAGTLALSGNNSYGPSAGTVGTALSSGTLQVGSNNALGTGDLSVLANSTLQAGAAVGLNNNIDVAPGVTATVDSSGNNFALNGTISDSGNLTKAGNGALTLNGYNTYTGNTIVNAGVLSISSFGNVAGTPTIILNGGDLLGNTGIDAEYANIGIGPTNGSVGGTGLIDAASGQLFTLYGTIASAGNTGTNNLVVNGGAENNGTVYMGVGNTYNGTTVISNGWLELGTTLALQNSTLNYSNQGGALVLDTGITSITLGGLTGAQNLGLTNLNGNAVTLTVGNNNASTIYSGNLNDAGSGGALDKVGSGTLTLTGTNIYTGATTLAGGTLTLTNGGQIVSAGAVNINNGGGSTFNVNGGSLSAASMTMNNNNVGFIQSSGTSSFTNNVSFAADNANSGNSLQILGGTFNANSLTSGRTGLNFSTQPTAGQTTTVGIYITNATVNFTNTLGVGGRSSGANSSTSMRMDGGTLNVGGTTTITINNGGRWSVLDINGGTFISTDTNGAGVQIGGVYASESALFLIRAGTVSVNKITFGDLATQTSGTDVLNLTGGALYVGAGGIIITNPSPTFGTFITMSGGTVGASADWVSVLPITLSANVTFQAADIANVAHNITLSNALSGAGGLTKTGNGNLTLSAANAYTNSTVISGGTLVLSGTASIADSTNIDVVSGAQLDVSAVSPWTLVNGQTLKGSGSVIGSSVIAAGGSRIAPGESGLGTLTFGGALSLNGTTAMELNRAASPNSDRIVAASIAAGGTLTVTNIGAGLQAGDVFHLFSTAVSGSFAVTNLPATDPVNNLNYTWTNKLAVDGTIEVLTATSLINTNAFTLTNGFDGSKLTLSWPLDHTGYRLQAQTNTLTIGLYTNWVDIDAQFTPAANTTNKVNIPVNAGNGSVFYRLIYP